MKLPNVKSLVLAAVFIVIAPLSFAGSNNFLLDMLTLQEGKTSADAEAYFAKVGPIIEKHGLKKVDYYTVSAKMRGWEGAEPQIINVWKVKNPEAFKNIFADPEYLQHTGLRDSVFDMTKASIWMMEKK